MKSIVPILLFWAVLKWMSIFTTCPCWAANEGELEINIADKATGKAVAARMHIKTAAGKTVPPASITPPKTVWWNDHFVFDGQIKLKLKPGTYRYARDYWQDLVKRATVD